MKVVFKNFHRSEIVENIVRERVGGVIDKFPDLAQSDIMVTLSEENSPFQAGPDEYGVKLIARGGRYRDLVLKKSSQNLYIALAMVIERLSERLKRHSERTHSKWRRESRKMISRETLETTSKRSLAYEKNGS